MVNNILVVLLLLGVACLIIGMIRPKTFIFLLKKYSTRKGVFLFFGIFSVAAFLTIGFTANKAVETGVLNSDSSVAYQNATTDKELVQGVVFQGAFVEAIIRYADARLYTDRLFSTYKNISDKDRRTLLDKTIQKLASSLVASDQLRDIGEWLPNYNMVAAQKGASPFVLVHTARAETLNEAIKKLEDEEKRLQQLGVAWQKEKELGGREKVLEIYDKAPSGEKIQAVANALGVDAKVAYEELTRMRNLEAKIGVKQAEIFNNYSNAAQVVKTGTKVELFIAGMLPAAAGSSIAFVGKTAAEAAVGLANSVFTSIAGAGVIMEVSETAVSVGIADKDGAIAAIAKAKDAKFFKQFSMITAIMDPLKAYGQFQKALEVAGGLKNLIAGDGVKKILGDAELMTNMKYDAVGNVQTIIDSGPQTWDFISDEDSIKTVLLNASMVGELLFEKVFGAPQLKDIAITPYLSDMIQTILMGATLPAGAVEPLPEIIVPEQKKIEAIAPKPTPAPKPKPVVAPAPAPEPTIIIPAPTAVVEPTPAPQPVDNSAKIAECAQGEKDRYNSGVSAMANARDPSAYPKYSCDPQGAYQEYPPQSCCNTYETNRGNDAAWYDLQVCGWGVEVKKREQAYNTKLAECTQKFNN